MRIAWQITNKDIKRVRAFVREQADDAFVRYRRTNNLAKAKPQVRRQRFWHCFAGMRLTSNQRAGPHSRIAKFNRTKPYPIDYKTLLEARNAKTFIATTLTSAGIRRHHRVIAEQLSTNLRCLEDGEWDRMLEHCNSLTRRVTSDVEREAANYIEDTFIGFGPKQSRNVLQALGLTRFEIPIDSRVIKWLNQFGFPVKLNAAALGDRDYYEFVLDGIQQLCAASGVFPTILDAAIFAKADDNGWSDETVY